MVDDQRTTEELVRDLRAGRHTEACSHTLFTRFYPQVCRFFLRKGLSLEDSRELAQEVFLAVFRNVDDLEEPAHFTGWLFTIARNAFANELDRRYAHKRGVSLSVLVTTRPEHELAPEEQVPDARPNALEQILDREKVRHLRQVLQDLPPQMRRCVEARIVDNQSYGQIAEHLGISINTVKAHLFKAREQIGRRLRPLFGDVEM